MLTSQMSISKHSKSHPSQLAFKTYRRCYRVMLISSIFLLLPSVLSVSALPSTPALALAPALPVSSNSSFAVIAECFTPATGYSVLTVRDCIRAVDLIRQDPSYERPRRWSSLSEGHRIIEQWTWGECVIVVYPREASAEDVFPLAEVLEKAMLILQACVATHSKRGGRMKLGPEEVFGVGIKAIRVGSS